MLLTLVLVGVFSLSKLATGVAIVTGGIIYRSDDIFEDGQTLLLGGLFPVHTAGEAQPPCGTIRPSAVQTVEAMVLAVRSINEDQSLLPNVTLAFDIRDTCLTVNYALRQSADYITSACTDDGSSLAVSSVVGAFQSTISEAAANLYGLFEVPQISYGSSAAVLSDKSRYEYFFRTIPSDLFQVRALADIVVRFGWRYIIVLHSDDLYGTGGRDAFRRELVRRNMSRYCIADEIELSDSPPNYQQAVDLMNRNWVRNASVVLLFGHLENAVGMLGVIKERVGKDPDFPLQNLTWLASDSWGDNLPTEYQPLARGMLSTVPKQIVIQAFDDYFTSLDPLNNMENPWFDEYWEATFQCNLGLSPDLPDCDIDNQTLAMSNYTQFSLVPLVFEAVFAFARSVHDLIETRCPNGTLCSDILIGETANGSLLREALINLSASTGPFSDVVFNENGDVEGRYSILNLQTDPESGQLSFKNVGVWTANDGLTIREEDIEWVTGTDIIPQSICSRRCRPGEVRQFVVNQPECCFRCMRCPPNGVAVSDTRCRRCALGERPNGNRTRCTQNPLVFFRWIYPEAIVLVILTSIGVAATLFVGVIIFANYRHEFIKASSRELSAILLCGILLCFIVPFFYIAQPSAVICGFRRFILGFGFALSYSALLVRTNRIHRIFNRSRHTSTKQLRFISPLSQVLITTIFVSVQVVINIVWFAVEPPATRVVLGASVNELTCASSPQVVLSVSLAYSFVLLLLSTYFAFLTRKVPANFNEAKYINGTVYSILIIWLAFVPTYFATANLGTTFQTGSLAFGVILSTATTLCCLFVSKVVILFRKKKKEETTMKGESMNSSHTNNLATLSTSERRL